MWSGNFFSGLGGCFQLQHVMGTCPITKCTQQEAFLLQGVGAHLSHWTLVDGGWSEQL